MAGVAQQWNNEDILTLLCTLNLKIEEIRATTKDNNRKGLNYASELISREIGDGCTSSRVERKIKQLWANYGHPEGGKDPYNLCLYGVFPKTLPGIGPTLLSAVASRVEEIQRQAFRSPLLTTRANVYRNEGVPRHQQRNQALP